MLGSHARMFLLDRIVASQNGPVRRVSRGCAEGARRGE
jgi:hypothetical protein